MICLYPPLQSCFLGEKIHIEVLGSFSSEDLSGWGGAGGCYAGSSQDSLYIDVAGLYLTSGQRCAAVLRSDLHTPVTLQTHAACSPVLMASRSAAVTAHWGSCPAAFSPVPSVPVFQICG